MKKLFTIFAAAAFCFAANAQSLPITGTFNANATELNVPAGWTYISNDPVNYPDLNAADPGQDFYVNSNGGFKWRFEGQAWESPTFTTSSDSISVVINIAALNSNSRSVGSAPDVFVVTGYNSTGDVVTTGSINTVPAAGDYSALLVGSGIVKIRATMTKYPYDGSKCYNINCKSITVKQGGTSSQEEPPIEPNTELPVTTNTISNAIPAGWTYIGTPLYPDPYFYNDGTLRLNNEGYGIATPGFYAWDSVTVKINVAALNQNTRTSTTGNDVFTVTGLNVDREVVATAEVNQVPAAGDFTVNLVGDDIVMVKVVMTAFPYDGSLYYNVGLGSVTVSKTSGGGTGIEKALKTQKPQVFVSNSNLFLKNVANKTRVDIFSVVGAKIKSVIFDGSSIDLSNLVNGMYIVRMGNHSEKIILQK